MATERFEPQGTSSAESRIARTSAAEASMQPPEKAIDGLFAEWVRNADLGFQTVVRLSPDRVT